MPRSNGEGLRRYVERLAGRGPPWLKGVRHEALEMFMEGYDPPADSPTVKHYTRMEEGELYGYASQVGGEEDLHIDVDPPRMEGGVVTELEEASGSERWGKTIRETMFSVVPVGLDHLSMMNAALWCGGVFVHVGRGVEMNVPLRITTRGGNGVLRRVILVEEGARVNLVLDVEGGAFRNEVTEVIVRRDARAEICLLHDAGAGMRSILRSRARVEGGGSVEWYPGVFGSMWCISHVESVLAGEGARSGIYGVFLGSGEGHQDISTSTVHLAPRTSGTVLMRGVMLHRSNSVSRGMIDIVPEAVHCSAMLTQETILLGGGARANSVPSLRIRTNEVNAKHSASVSMLDEEQVYYLMGRGIPRFEAERLLVNGFINPVRMRVPVEDVRSRIKERISHGLRDR